MVADCYEKRSIIITTNLEFSKWNGIFYEDVYKRQIQEPESMNDCVMNMEIYLMLVKELYELMSVSYTHLDVYKRQISVLAEEGAQGIILGCTEIGLLVHQKDTAVPLFDTALIHAQRAALYALDRSI